MSIATCAPEVAETGFVARVVTDQCPTTPDGRPKHYLTKVAGVFVCAQCGAPDPRRSR